MNKVPHLEMAQHYWNVIVPKYPNAPWERVESRNSSQDNWIVLGGGHPSWFESCQYRFKPETIMLNGIQLPEPLRVEPQDGGLVYCILNVSSIRQVLPSSYCHNDSWLLESGFLHATQKAAQAWVNALVKVASGKQEAGE